MYLHIVIIVAVLVSIGHTGSDDTGSSAACLVEARNSSTPCQTFHICCQLECSGANYTASCSEERQKLVGTCVCHGDGDEASSNGNSTVTQCGRPAVPPKVPRPGRIVGGEESNANSWPWQVSLQTSWGHLCGGSLIDQKHVITAGHCLAGISANEIKVIVGLHDQGSTSTSNTYTVASMETHEDYTSDDRPVNDIAMLTLSRPVQFDRKVSPVCASEEEVDIGQVCITTGWGRTKGTGDNRKLLQVALQIKDRKVCNETGGPYFNGHVDETMICSGAPGKSGCHGDSGGPLVCQRPDKVWELQGIVSWGSPDCDQFSMFTRVVFFKDWIAQRTGN